MDVLLSAFPTLPLPPLSFCRVSLSTFLIVGFFLLISACGSTPADPISESAPPSQEAFLDTLQARTFDFFWETTNPANGLTPDRSPSEPFSSVAAVGFALTAYPIGVERGYVSHGEARERTLTTLEFFWEAPQGEEPSGVSGHWGFFYHFLDMDTGHRHEDTELSTIAPTAANGSVPFAPKITIDALKAMRDHYGDLLFGEYGFRDAFNPTFTFQDEEVERGRVHGEMGWFDEDYLGIDQGPIVTMIENHRSGLIWELMRENPDIQRGLQRAGFTGGWLEQVPGRE